MKKIILIDNYDSFTFNLYHYLSSLKVFVDVIRNDKITSKEILKRRYNKIVIATDADVDGMHIRLLIITFFLQFFPELIKEGHLFILQTPMFRVRNKK